MGSFSDYLENEILDHVFGTGSYSPPTHLYIALCKSTLSDTSTGDLPGEITGGAYARKICDTWDAASGGATENTQVVTFAQATADWGTINYFAIVDSITVGSGNVIGWGALTASKNIASGDTFKFATGDIDVTLT
jgi:hypothetical protein